MKDRQQQPTRQGGQLWPQGDTRGRDGRERASLPAWARAARHSLCHATQEQLQPTRDATNRQDRSQATAADRSYSRQQPRGPTLPQGPGTATARCIADDSAAAADPVKLLLTAG